MASIPSQRYNKPNWLILHNNHCLLAKNSNATTLLIGDSIIAGLNRYPSVWNKYFGNNSVNFRIRGDRVENVLCRSINLPILSSLKTTLKNHSWDIFKKRGLHIIHLNINSLLPKIDEVRHIDKSSNLSVIGLSETKLDDSVFDAEINIEGYTLIRSDRNRHGGGVACYVKQHLTFDVKYYFSNEIENIFIDIFLPKTKPFTLGFF